MKRSLLRVYLLIAGIVFLCLTSSYAETARLRLATTTSTENSGLLDYLLPLFQKETGIKVDVIAVGTGKALKLGENGDVDVVLVHARSAEEAFVENGLGVNRREVMYNDFVVAGPRNDPEGLRKLKSVEAVFAVLARGESLFVSRGDDSGTHKKEKELWKSAGVEPRGKWYLETGQGMGATLQIADEKQAYCLIDRGTYIAFREKLGLDVCFDGDRDLLNSYGIIAVNPARHKHVKYREAMRLIEWIVSPEGQKAIGVFKKRGKQLFHPVQKRDRS